MLRARTTARPRRGSLARLTPKGARWAAAGRERGATTKFPDSGGFLPRFAAPRLAAGDDDLTPTELRRGGRLLGGALSWDTPKHLAAFEPGGPFFGLAAPDDVIV